MNLRELLNVIYAFVMKGRTPEQKSALDAVLAEKRYADMDERERARFDRKMEAMRTGAYTGQGSLVGAMGLPQGRQRPGRRP